MRRQIFFVTAYGIIYNKVLPLIEERKKYGEITIVAINDDLEMFLKEYTDFKVIRLHVNPNLVTQKTKYKLIWNIIKSKREYRKIFGNIRGTDIHFFTRSYAIVTFSYIKKLTKNNKVYQYCDDAPVDFPIVYGLLPLAMKLIAKIFLNVDIKVRSVETQSVCVLSENFYKNIIKNPNKSFDTSVSSTYIKEIKQLKGKNILLLTSNVTDVCSFITEDEVVRVINILMNMLKGKYDDIIIKNHPNDDYGVYGKMKELHDFVPSYIASEFLVNHNWEFVIGIVSTSLLTFAKQSKIRVVSIIKMLEWEDTVIRDYWLGIYKKLPILMPENEEELAKILQENT